jgi:hypothetical protein
MLQPLKSNKKLMPENYGIKLFTMRGNLPNRAYCFGIPFARKPFLTAMKMKDLEQFLPILAAKSRFAHMIAAASSR